MSNVSSTQIKRMFALADKDKDGKLSVGEWQQMLAQAGAPADKYDVYILYILHLQVCRLCIRSMYVH